MPLPSRSLALTAALVLMLLAGCSSSDSAPVKTDHVAIPGAWTFDPKTIEVAAGTTITWTNHGGQTHSVTFDDASVGLDQDVAPGHAITMTLTHPGTYTYHCKYHPPGMVGKVIVD